MTKLPNEDMLGNIISDTFTITKIPDQSQSSHSYTLFYSIKESGYYNLYIKTLSFFVDFSYEISLVYSSSDSSNIVKINSGFYTESLEFIILYVTKNANLKINAFSQDFSKNQKSSVYSYSSYDENLFFKAIHLKGEIGFFIFFEEDSNYPKFSILECDTDSDYNMIAYSEFENIELNKKSFNTDRLLNDIIKINDFKICYISVNSEKTYLYLVIITLYKNDTLMNIRYYNIEMSDQYSINGFLNLKASLYKNFISLAFSHCIESTCSSYNSSLIIFSYPNSTDYTLDLIKELKTTNKKIENDFSFNFEETLKIENNIFGFVFKGTKIIDIENGIYLKNVSNLNIIEADTILLDTENVFLSFDTHTSYQKKDYVIEYAFVLREQIMII